MLNLSEIHPNVRKTLHEIENAMVRDISPNTTQASVGQKIKDIYAKSTFTRMFSAVDSTKVYELDDKGEQFDPPRVIKNSDGGMNMVSIMGGELSKDGDGNFKHISGFQEMYNANRWDEINESNTTNGKLSDRYRPLPGITSVSVEFAGSMKAIRNATINWTCFSFSDISRLTPHFLAHGKPVVLEWGWSSTKDMNDVRMMDIEKISDGSAYKQIQKQIWDMNGKYDAMAGLIKNFEWKTRDDGGFDCTTEITSLGVNTLNQQTKNEMGGSVDNIKKPEGEEDEGKFRTVPTFEEFVGQLDKEIGALCSEGGFFGSTYFSPEIQPNGLMYFESKVRLWGDKTFGPYLTWGWMEDNIISKFLGKINKPKSGEQVFSDFRSLVPVMEDGKPKYINNTGDMELESVKIANHPALITADIAEFIFPGQWPYAGNHTIDGFWGVGEDWKVTQTLHKMINETRRDDFPTFAVEGDATKGYLRNIILHWEVVKEAFTGVTSVESGLQNIFNKLNARYGIWNFKVTTSSIGKEGRCMVIDENYTHRSVRELLDNESKYVGPDSPPDGLLYKFNVMNERSIVKSHNLTAKLPSSMQTAAMFGANKRGETTTSAGNPGAVRLGKISSQNPDESIGEMDMAWSRPNFGTNESQDPNYNKGDLTLDDGPGITINPGEGESTDTEKDTGTDPAKEARDKSMKAQLLDEELEKVFVTNLTHARDSSKPKAGEVATFINEDGEPDKAPVFEMTEEDQKPYDEYGCLKQVGEIKWSDVMKGIITSGPKSSNAQRDLLIPMELEIEVTGIGGIVPGNAFITSYLPASYREWVAFQATDISHTIGTDGWTTSLKGLMRCAGTPKGATIPREQQIRNYEETKDKMEIAAEKGYDTSAAAKLLAAGRGETYGEEPPFVGPIWKPDPDPEKEKEKEAARLKAERDAANKKKKAEEERKRKEAERKKKEADKRESKQKKQKKRKLISTYKGHHNQNDKILYVRQPQWRPIKAGGTKNYSFFGEGAKEPVDFVIRQQYWDRNIERPTVDGVSRLHGPW